MPALVAVLALAACSGGTEQPGTTGTAASGTGAATGPATASPEGTATSRPGPPRVVATIASGLSVPWGLGFLPDGDAVVTERDTRRVLLIHGPQHVVRTIGTIDKLGTTAPQGEAGLLGVAVSPSFASDRRLYFYVNTALDNRIVWATYRGGRLGPLHVVLSGIPHGLIHDGGRLAFGPDGFLYASTGETGDGNLAQDLSSLGGKILRITPGGEPAPGNPFPGSPVWSYGHRNVEGLAFDDRGRLWASELGHDQFDELNLIEPGHNYGWPIVEGQGGPSGLTDPQVVWPTDEASPSGLAWLDGHLWLAALRGMRLWRVDAADGHATATADFFVGDYGRMRTVAVAPDGRLWVTTSNRDGRGSPAPGDDRILLIAPS